MPSSTPRGIPGDKGLLGTTLHYDYEVRKADDYFDDIPAVKIPNDLLKLAEHILESKEGDFQPDLFVDHYETALVEVISKKHAHVPFKKAAERPAAGTNVINLMHALRRSVASDTGKSTPEGGIGYSMSYDSGSSIVGQAPDQGSGLGRAGF